MKSLDSLNKHMGVLKVLNRIPKRILTYHSLPELTSFILHELCHEECFDIRKAAYLVDNPDFNCTKGVAGFTNNHAFADHDEHWNRPEEFCSYIEKESFNGTVRTLNTPSTGNIDNTVEMVANILSLENYAYCTWPLKHDNHGIFIYEPTYAEDTLLEDHLEESLHMLGFCPIH